jgi:hypothetical protein
MPSVLGLSAQDKLKRDILKVLQTEGIACREDEITVNDNGEVLVSAFIREALERRYGHFPLHMEYLPRDANYWTREAPDGPIGIKRFTVRQRM